MGTHDKFLPMIQRLLAKNGRPVTLIELETAGAVPGEGPADPRNPPKRSLTTVGCFVEPDSLQRLGISTAFEELLQRSKRICLVPGSAGVLDGYTEILDESKYYGISGIETLRPGTTTLLHFVGTKR
jgi:hypothetical protein